MSKQPVRIAPSILSADFAQLGAEVAAIDKAGADYIHIDVMDGHFVPNLTFGAPVVKCIRPHSKKIFDVHLMIEPVEPLVDDFAKAGADIITAHIEIAEDIRATLSKIKAHGIKCGISVKPGTGIETIENVMDLVDLILIMTVEPGFGGQSFMDMSDKICAARTMIDKATKGGGRVIDLEVDGGINAETAKTVIAAGADVLVAGSYVFKGGPQSYAAQIESLRG